MAASSKFKTILLLLVLPTAAVLTIVAALVLAAANKSSAVQQANKAKQHNSDTAVEKTNQLPASASIFSPAAIVVDGEFKTDGAGNLIINHDIRRIFDFYLSFYSGQELAVIEKLLAEKIKRDLKPPASMQALALMKRYLAMLSSQQMQQHQPPPGQDLAANFKLHLQLAHEKRDAYLSAQEQQAFYAQEDTYNQYMLQKLAIIENQNSSASAEQLTALLHTLPASLQKQIKNATLISDLNRSSGNSSHKIELYRQYYGAQAAANIENLQRQRQHFAAKFAAYYEKKQQILRRELDKKTQQMAIESLQKSMFDSRQRLRLDALEQQQLEAEQKPAQK